MNEIDEIKEFLRELDLTREKLESLCRQLAKNDMTLDIWKRRTEQDWLRRFPNCGDDIYNYLHPRSQGNRVLIAGMVGNHGTFETSPKLRMNEIEKIKEFLRELDLTREELESLYRQLAKNDMTLDIWKRRTEQDWKDYYQLAGIDIYNYLHPRIQGNRVLIAGMVGNHGTFETSPKLRMNEIEKIKEFLRELDLTREELESLYRQLAKNDMTLDIWKRRTEQDWKDYYQLAGIDIYNYLNPRSQGN